MSEIREVAAPGSIAAPQHTMSPEGAARLAALEAGVVAKPEELKVSAGTPNTVKDADGGTANLEDGTFTPPARPDPQPGERQPNVDILEAIPEAFVPEKYAEDAAAYRIDAAMIAQDAGIPAAEMGALYQFVINNVAADIARDEHDAHLDRYQNPGASLRDPDQTRQRLLAKYGETGYKAIVAAAAKEFHALPDSVKAWIDDANEHGDRKGNNPAFVVGLALRAYARLSPEAAQRELANLRKEPGYAAGDQLIKDKVAMLNYVIAGSPQQQVNDRMHREGGRTPKPAFSTGGVDDVMLSTLTAMSGDQMRAEMKKLTADLTDTRGELSSNPKKRKAAIARRAALMQKLSGGDK
jgi:hypothetical protein